MVVVPLKCKDLLDVLLVYVHHHLGVRETGAPLNL
jgi:hypothetical protein